MLPRLNPFEFFTETDGSPLDGGKVYIGTVNQNPKTSPITVYFDSAMTIPAPQPLQTVGGRIVKNGAAAAIYSNAASFSILVENSNGQQVSYSAAAYSDTADFRDELAGSSGSSLIGFLQYGSGAAASTVQTKLRESVSVKDFGAVGDGSTDDTAAFTAALAAAQSVHVPASSNDYVISGDLTMPDGRTIFGDGWFSRIRQSGSGKNVLVAGNQCAVISLHLIGADESTVSDFTKQNAVYAVGKRGLTVADNFIEKCSANGVMLDSCTDFAVERNRIFACKYVLGSGSDITLYSASSAGRASIVENFCLSNNSQGIYVDALGKDADVIVQGNICATLDPATCTLAGAWSEIGSGSLIRRHGIVVGYNSSSVNGPRAIVTGNICRNTLWTGIYKQGVSSGPVDIKHNQCSNNGYTLGNSLSGGIYAIADGMTRIESNTIIGYQGDSAGAITVNATTTPTTRTAIVNNRILSSAAYGVYVGTNSALLDIIGNEIRSSTVEDIFVSLNGGSASVGGIRIEANDIVRSVGDKRSVYMDLQASTLKSTVARNRITGTGNTVTTSIGLEIRLPASDVDVFDNDFTNLYWGVKVGGYITGGRLFSKVYERNRFNSINTAWGLSSTGTTEVVPLVANIYTSVTTKSAANASIGGNNCGYICDKQGDNLTVYGVTAAPTNGTWIIGDRAVRTPAVGSPKAWSVTAAGAPGTWTSEGNL